MKSITHTSKLLKPEQEDSLRNLIFLFKDDDEMLNIITQIIMEFSNLDPNWHDTISKIISMKINKRFIKKIKKFFNNIYNSNNLNFLLIINILLESFDTIEDLHPNIQEETFYVILNEIHFIFKNNKENNNIYIKSINLLKDIKNKLL